ncbi:YfiR family protein [Parvularcula maris]|uniref:YfiR family protein n=1 Tax=Parvularcula maris TaxID=2965077 RepID=A0A9X2L6H4_9PROT|nr:YfiR family protein [Parvularcula maris]MCQ8183936.1 YfiR family protein [Parvularcula maris]
MLGQRARRLVAAMGLGVVLPGSAAAGQGASHDHARMLVNLARFAEWPEERDYGSTFRICLRDDDPAITAFSSVAGQEVRGLTVSLHTLAPSAMGSRPCHAVYFSAGLADKEAVASLGHEPVLTVSPSSGFTAMGGMIELQTGGITPTIVVSADVIRDHPLRISAQLLSMAEVLP